MAYADRPQVYDEFLKVMKRYKAQSINTLDVIGCVKLLFKGNNKLIRDFNVFLPDDRNITIEDEDGASASNVTHAAAVPDATAITYVTRIRNRFVNEPETYRTFLKILHTYQKEQKGIKEVLEQVSELFADHPDLLAEFTHFLPDSVQVVIHTYKHIRILLFICIVHTCIHIHFYPTESMYISAVYL